MELIVGNRRITPSAIQPVSGGVEARLKGEALLRLLDASFHGQGTIEVIGGGLDRRPMEVADIRMTGADTTVRLRCTGPAPRLV
ncbi:hypothetical protein [Neotabrizicola sp. VNH66]|uniref:hypothetical protein n=1 Tax=Neotabrizicola sp. VNH66 TaxID=3400918 RepID=UPI003C03816A